MEHYISILLTRDTYAAQLQSCWWIVNCICLTIFEHVSYIYLAAWDTYSAQLRSWWNVLYLILEILKPPIVAAGETVAAQQRPVYIGSWQSWNIVFISLTGDNQYLCRATKILLKCYWNFWTSWFYFAGQWYFCCKHLVETFKPISSILEYMLYFYLRLPVVLIFV